MGIKNFLKMQMDLNALSISTLANELDRLNREQHYLCTEKRNGEPNKPVQITYEHVKRLLAYKSDRIPKRGMLTLLASYFGLSIDEVLQQCRISDDDTANSNSIIKVSDIAEFKKKFEFWLKSEEYNEEDQKKGEDQSENDLKKQFEEEKKIYNALLAIDNENGLPKGELGDEDQWVRIMHNMPESTHLFYVVKAGVPEIVGDLTLVLLPDPESILSDSKVSFEKTLPMSMPGTYKAQLLSLQLNKEYNDIQFLVEELLNEIKRLADQKVFLDSIYYRIYDGNCQLANLLGFEKISQTNSNDSQEKSVPLFVLKNVVENLEKYKSTYKPPEAIRKLIESIKTSYDNERGNQHG